MMTDTDHLAAEYALGLLDGEELLRARGMQAHDLEFAKAVSRWQEHFAPLLINVPSSAPRADLWDSIEAEISTAPISGANVIPLESQVRRWKMATGLASAAAAILLAFTFLPTQQAPVSALPAPAPLAASLPVGDTGLRLGVTYIADRQELLVSAAGLSADGVHDHELWIVTEDGAESLGVVSPGRVKRTSLDEALAEQLADGADLVLTREPLGGALQGAEAGPVVASGTFTAI